MEIIIDGYNLINASTVRGTLEQSRALLLKRLEQYYRFRHHKITVVFDGWKQGFPVEGYERIGSINVIFSRKGEKADELIKQIVRGSSGSLIVVTSDRGIAQDVERHGAEVIGSREFESRLKMAAVLSEHTDKEEYDESLDKPISTKKKGNPEKRPKQERRRRQRLSKL